MKMISESKIKESGFKKKKNLDFKRKVKNDI